MKASRLVFLLGMMGALYAPVASAKFAEDVIPASMQDSLKYDYPGQMLDNTTSTPALMNFPTTNLNDSMTRASFTAMVIDHLYTQKVIDSCYWNIAPSLPPTFTLLYTDVPASAPYAKELCVAMQNGLARGYKDGSFHPNKTISFAEAAKILTNAYGLAPYAEATMKPSDTWFSVYAFAIVSRNAVPTTVTAFDHVVTVGQTIEMLDRLGNDIRNRPSASYASLVKEWKARTMPKPVASVSSTTTTSKPVVPTTQKKPTSMPSNQASSMGSTEEQSSASSAKPWYQLF